MAKRTVITERDVLSAVTAGRTSIACPPGCVITPLARDAAAAKGVALLPGPDPASVPASAPADPRNWTCIAIGGDHRGYALKKRLIESLARRRLKVVDFGTDSDAPCAYPEFAYAVARAVGTGSAQAGIVIDGTGAGSAMVANKVRGVRAVNGTDVLVVQSARAHNDANVLALGGGIVAPEYAEKLLDTFLGTGFDGGRHDDRLALLRDIEDRTFRG